MAVHLTPTELLRLAPFGAIAPAEIQGDDPGTYGSVTQTGTGTGKVLVSGYPADALSIVVKVLLAGDLGVMQIAVSKDGGATYGNAVQSVQPPQEFQTVPFIATPEWRYEVPLSGVILRLQNGSGTPNSFVLNDTYSFSTTASPRLLVHCQAASDEYDEWFRNQYDKPEDATPNTIQKVHMANITRWRLTGGRGLDEIDRKTQETFFKQGIDYYTLQSIGDLRTPTIPDELQFPMRITVRPPYKGDWRH